MTKSDPSYKGLKSTVAGIVVNFVLAAVKGIAGVVGNSYALIADAIESVSDIFTSVIVYLGIKVASKKPNEEFPYGHGKAEPIAGATVSVILIFAAGVIVFNSIGNILTPHEVPETFTLYVLMVVIFTKEILFRYVLKVSEETESTAVKADAWHHRSDAITSGAAFVGILVAVIGGPGYESADDWAALIASGFIVFNAWNILIPSVKEIMDAAPPSELLKEVIEIAGAVNGVLDIDKTYIRKMGFEYYVDMHVVVDGEISVKSGHDIAHKVKDEILRQKPRISNVFVHIEPFDPDYNKDRT